MLITQINNIGTAKYKRILITLDNLQKNKILFFVKKTITKNYLFNTPPTTNNFNFLN